jgi:hypothetical protein
MTEQNYRIPSIPLPPSTRDLIGLLHRLNHDWTGAMGAIRTAVEMLVDSEQALDPEEQAAVVEIIRGTLERGLAINDAWHEYFKELDKYR